jgi:hypothetical protein
LNASMSKSFPEIDFIPSANALRLSTYALHEQLGRWWYRLRY